MDNRPVKVNFRQGWGGDKNFRLKRVFAKINSTIEINCYFLLPTVKEQKKFNGTL